MIKFYAVYSIDDLIVATFDNYKELCSYFKKTKNCMQSAVSNFKANRIDSIKSNEDGKYYKVYVMEFTEDSYYD